LRASTSIKSQKSGLKVNILNLLKLSAKFLVGHFLVKNEEIRSTNVTNFIQVLKLYEYELFGDAYYDINYRKNVNSKEPTNLPQEDDINLLMEECERIMASSSTLDFPTESFTTVRSYYFQRERGGEPI